MPVRVKICGVTTVEDAQKAAELGADAVGLNFHPGSPRYVGLEMAAQIASALPVSVEVVGVFVERGWQEIRETIAMLRELHSVQRHGEPLTEAPPASWRIVPAFGINDAGDLNRITRHIEDCKVRGWMPAAVLVDAHVAGLHGGTGRTAPWNILAEFRVSVPVMLAGGLTPENVAEAIRTVRPHAVDVASGVESRPGRKDAEKLKQFIDSAKSA
jgi:phosphoribosylanthranilate isomerase